MNGEKERIKNRKLLPLLMVGLMLFSFVMGLTACGEKTEGEGKGEEKTITDDAGRSVSLPREVTKCYYTSPVGLIMVYTLDPDKMAGWSFQLTDKEKAYIPEKYSDLPFLGGQQMNGKLNTEEIIKAAPQVIFSVVTDPKSELSISDADKLQEQLNIPVVVVDGELSRIDGAYAFMGEILGAEKQAKKLGAYCKNTVKEVTEATKDIPEDQRARVYYAEGPEGLATEPSGSMHSALLELVHGKNIAEVETKGKGGMSDVSMEQVLSWNPDVILSWSLDKGGAYDTIVSSDNWSTINAVKNKAVYEIPNQPFNWFDRPPSVNRMIGMKWLATTLYPDQYKIDLKKEVKEFYTLFYHIDLTDGQLNALLGNAVRK
ncbi:MAG: ABC transporter substrate-binding protein [Anaerovoracaceae bacterium]